MNNLAKDICLNIILLCNGIFLMNLFYLLYKHKVMIVFKKIYRFFKSYFKSKATHNNFLTSNLKNSSSLNKPKLEC